MNKIFVVVAALITVLAVGSIYLFDIQEEVPPVVVTITDEGYNPTRLDIKKDQVVQFVNSSSGDRWPASAIHPSHQVYPEFDPKEPVPAGETWSFKFDKVGSWRFHDHLLPQLTGVVNITE